MTLRGIAKKIAPQCLRNFYRMYKVKKQYGKTLYLLRQNSEFRNIHMGKRCFILGNGPSVNKLDFSILKDEITFTVNQLSRREDFYKIKTNYHMWADERFFDIDEGRPEDMELLRTMIAVKTADNNPVIFYKLPAHDMIKKYHLDETLNIRYFMECGRMSNRASCDFSKLVPSFSTVVHYLVLLAVYMGFKDIYLLGCDCTGIINTVQSRIETSDSMQYAYNITENERRRMLKSNTMYPIKDELRWYASIFDDYELLQKYCLRHNVNLLNATEGSLIDCLPKVQLSDVLH